MSEADQKAQNFSYKINKCWEYEVQTAWLLTIESERKKVKLLSCVRLLVIPWTEEPGGLQPIEWQTVGHN